MKILFFSHTFYPVIGGIESISQMLALNFHDRQDISILVVTRTKEIGKLQFPFQVIRDPSLRTLLGLIKWCDIVFENNPCLGMSWPNFLIRKPKVVGLHTWLVQPGKKIKIYQWVKKIALNDYNSVIACSNKIRSLTFNKAQIINNAYDSKLYNQSTAIKTKDFVFLGRLVSDKGADMCIDLINNLNQNHHKSYTLTIIGDGPEMEKLKNKVLELNLYKQVSLLGFLPPASIQLELRQHHFLLVPSRWEEPFGIVVLEGMGCGCIPIVSDGGGLPDAVGNAGVIFKRNSIIDLVTKTTELLNNKNLQKQIRENMETHLENHTVENVAQRYYDIIVNSYIS
jgi:glycosyltransferase involved in cell wall biosynthesis